jgi:hypothetical protein
MANLLSTTVNGQLNTGNVIDLGYTVNGSIATTAFRGINFHSFGDLNYYIGKPSGAWTQPLHIHFYTGIWIRSHHSYGGTRFYNIATGSNLMSIGDGADNINVYAKITSSITSGTVLSHGSMDDAIGWNSSYGTYIGSTVGGTSYLYANGTLYTGGAYRTLIHSGNIGSQSVSYATTANVANFFGGFTAYGLVEEARGVHSASDFPNGTLVTTDIQSNEWAGDSFVMEVSGKSYGSGTPFKLAMEGYLYADTIINVSAMSYGSYFPAPVKVMNLDGTLAFWWPRGSYWNSFQVHVRAAGGESWNRVTGISDSVDPPSATKKISITPVQVIHTNNIGSQSVSYATSAGDASTLGGFGRGNTTNKVAYFDGSRNLFVNNPESYSGEVRLGAAWGRGGVYASSTLSLSTSGTETHFVFNNSVPIIAYSNGQIDLGSSTNTPINITGGAHKYITINPGNGWEAMVRYVGGSGSSWYVGKRMTSQVVGTESFHFYSEAASQTVGGIDTSGNMIVTGSMRAPIFYDSNDTTYFLDPNGSISGIFAGSVGINNTSPINTAWGSASTTKQLSIDGTNYAVINLLGGSRRFSMGVGDAQFYMCYDNTAGRHNIIVNSSGSVSIPVDVRSPIFYDSADTNYYVDPNSNSKLVNLGLGGATPDLRLSVSGDIHMDGYIYQGGTAGVVNSWGSRTLVSSGNYVSNARSFAFNNVGYGSSWTFAIASDGAVTTNRHIDANTTWTNSATTLFLGWYGGKVVIGNNNNGNHDAAAALGGNTVISTNPLYAPIIYDLNDTGYYGNFAGFSRMSEVGTTNQYVYNYDSVDSGRAVNEFGHVGKYVSTQSASTNYIPFSFENRYGNHSWGHVARFHISSGSGTDRPSIQFSSGYNNTRWSVGYCSGTDDNFRITQNMGMRPDNSGNHDEWGTERFRINTDGSIYISSSLQAYSYQGHSNVAGTGNASYHPSGIYSTGTNWLYGTMYMNNNSIRDVQEIYNNGWFRTVGHQGLYNPTNDAHFYPNNASYGSWRIDGTRNGWHGLHFNSGSTLMMNSAETGIHREGYGWQFRWYNGSMYVSRGTYGGGTEYTVIDSGTIGSQSVSYASSAGGVSWGNVTSKPSRWLGEANLIYDNAPDTAVESGFWQSYLGSGNPTGTWFNYINVRHSNTGNVHGYQLGMSYYDNNLWFRSYQGNGTYQTWSRALGTTTDPYPSNMNQYVRTSDDVTFNTTTAPTILVNNHSDNTKGYRIHNTSGSSVSAMFTNSSNALVIAAGAFDQINLNKKVYVNGVALGVNVTPSSTAGRIDASNDIVAYSSSDERLKHNITPIENAIDKVKSLTGVEFDWKPEYKHAHGYEGHDTGIIAQQVQEVIPSAVRTNDTGFLAVRYEKLIGLLVEGMKEQQAQIEELKAKLDGLTK